jgi:cytochrome b561
MYLPTIVFMTRAPGMRSAAIGYLVLYNVMFVVPLAGILILVYLSVRSETLGRFLRRRLAWVEFSMVGLFGGLGTLVLWTI